MVEHERVRARLGVQLELLAQQDARPLRPQQLHDLVPVLDVRARRVVALLRSVSTDPDAFIRWSLALVLGMRQGECLGLTWDMVDLERGVVTVAWQQQQLRWEHGCARREDGWDCA